MIELNYGGSNYAFISKGDTRFEVVSKSSTFDAYMTLSMSGTTLLVTASIAYTLYIRMFGF